MKINFEKFDSIETFMKVIETRPKNKLMQGANSSRTGTEKFTGTKSYGEAHDLLKNGYDKPFENLTKQTGKSPTKCRNRLYSQRSQLFIGNSGTNDNSTSNCTKN